MDRRALLTGGAGILLSSYPALANDALRVAWKVARHGNSTYKFLVMSSTFAETFSRERMSNKGYIEAAVVATGELIGNQIAEMREAFADGTEFFIKIVAPGSVAAFDVIKEVSSRAFQMAREKGGEFKVYFDDSIAPAAREKWASASSWTKEKAVPRVQEGMQNTKEKARDLKDRFLPQKN
jgi:hypothetical protein